MTWCMDFEREATVGKDTDIGVEKHVVGGIRGVDRWRVSWGR